MSTPLATAALARLGVRLLALFFILDGLWQLLGNLLTSIHEFDPNYLGFYFRSQALYPLLGIAIGIAVFLLSDRLGRRVMGSDGR